MLTALCCAAVASSRRSLNASSFGILHKWDKSDERAFEAANKAVVKGRSMVHPRRLRIVWSEIQRLNEAGIEGDIVECGVWKGGSSALMAMADMHSEKNPKRTHWLYDTFEGFNEPTEKDGGYVMKKWHHEKSQGRSWAAARLEGVHESMHLSEYPAGLVRYIKGPVEKTLKIPQNLPDKIALLRLDTDFFESTMAELEILYPRLVPGGLVFIDDYCMAHLAGSRRAVDAWAEKHVPMGLRQLVDTKTGGRNNVRLHMAQCLWWRKPGGGFFPEEKGLPYGVPEALMKTDHAKDANFLWNEGKRLNDQKPFRDPSSKDLDLSPYDKKASRKPLK